MTVGGAGDGARGGGGVGFVSGSAASGPDVTGLGSAGAVGLRGFCDAGVEGGGAMSGGVTAIGGTGASAAGTCGFGSNTGSGFFSVTGTVGCNLPASGTST